jgi:hypothetical protein
VLSFIASVFDLPLIGIFKTLHVMLFLLAVAFGSAVRSLQLLHIAYAAGNQFATPNYEVSHLSKRWRAERNLWLAGFAFTIWAVLAAFYREARKRMQLEDRLVEFELSDYTQTLDDTTRDASVSREVSSRPRPTPRSMAASPQKAPRPAERAAAAAPAAAAAVREPAAPAAAVGGAGVVAPPAPVETLVKKDL